MEDNYTAKLNLLFVFFFFRYTKDFVIKCLDLTLHDRDRLFDFRPFTLTSTPLAVKTVSQVLNIIFNIGELFGYRTIQSIKVALYYLNGIS